MADAWAAPVMLGLAIGRIGCFMAGCCWGDICASPQALAPVTDPRVSFKIQTFPALSPDRFPLAVRFPRDAGAWEQHTKLNLISSEATRSLPVHPVQLYEAGLAFLFCFLLHRNFQKRRCPGDIFWAMMIGYGVIRFTTEFFRADNSPAYGGLTISQVISVFLILAGGGALMARMRFAPRPRVAINPLP
jgi:phosphatidylglycerol:prolipoprotein diacylglycerol transferase